MLIMDRLCWLRKKILQPGYPIAAASRGKKVLVGVNETFAVGDHDFSKFALIPDAVLVHDIHESAEPTDQGKR